MRVHWRGAALSRIVRFLLAPHNPHNHFGGDASATRRAVTFWPAPDGIVTKHAQLLHHQPAPQAYAGGEEVVSLSATHG